MRQDVGDLHQFKPLPLAPPPGPSPNPPPSEMMMMMKMTPSSPTWQTPEKETENQQNTSAPVGSDPWWCPQEAELVMLRSCDIDNARLGLREGL